VCVQFFGVTCPANWRTAILPEGEHAGSLAPGNIGNVMPPLAPRAFSNQNTNADIATYSPIGRLVYGDVAVSFR
jgi:hypothetical protein